METPLHVAARRRGERLGGGRALKAGITYVISSVFEMRSAVVKKRYGEHDLTVRELQITREGLQVGAPREELIGVLTGSPAIAKRSSQGAGPSPEASGSESNREEPS